MKTAHYSIDCASIHNKNYSQNSESQTQIHKWISKFATLKTEQVSFEVSLAIDPDPGFRKNRDKISMRAAASERATLFWSLFVLLYNVYTTKKT